MEIHCYRFDDTSFRVLVLVNNETIYRVLIEAKSSFDAILIALRHLRIEGKLPE